MGIFSLFFPSHLQRTQRRQMWLTAGSVNAHIQTTHKNCYNIYCLFFIQITAIIFFTRTEKVAIYLNNDLIQNCIDKDCECLEHSVRLAVK